MQLKLKTLVNIVSFCLASFALSGRPVQPPLIQELFEEIRRGVEKTDDASSFRTEVVLTLNELKKKNIYQKSGKDETKRPIFVNIQNATEQTLAHWLKSGKLSCIVGCIHTPVPATPLCTEVGSMPPGLMDASYQNSNQIQYTVSSRATTVRNLLNNGGNIYAVYSKNGLAKRSVEAQSIYQQTLARFSKSLYDCPLKEENFDNSKTGATYLFQDRKRKCYVFSIKASQVNHRADDEWALVYGSLGSRKVKERLSEILKYIDSGGQPKVKLAFEKVARQKLTQP